MTMLLLLLLLLLWCPPLQAWTVAHALLLPLPRLLLL